jgi:HEAT repeat protein
VAEAQSNRREAAAGEADRLIPVRADVYVDPPGIAGDVTESSKSGLASERAAAVMEVARVGGEDAFRHLGAAFDDPAQQVRDAAARALFNMSADRASSFKRIMRDASRERRRRIGAAIASSGMAREALNDLTGESGARAYDALLVLSLMAKAGEVQPLVTTIEEHPSTEVRLAIVKLLALSGRQEILSTFRYLATRDSLPVVVRSSIMEAIYEINNQKPLDQPAA